MRKHHRFILIVLASILLMTACGGKNPNGNSTTTPSILPDSNSSTDVEQSTGDTYLHVEGMRYLEFSSPCDGMKEFAEQCFADYAMLQHQLDSSCETSSIFAMNNSGEISHTLSDSEAELVRLGLRYSELTGGAFDITSEPLRQLWDVSTEYFTLPSEDVISYTLSLIDYENVTLNGGDLQFGVSGMMLNTADLFDGYALDRFATAAKESSITEGILRIGSLSYYIGAPNGKPHTVSLVTPDGEASREVASIKLSDYAVATANVYDQYYEEDGTLYHPLFNLHTGYPSTAEYVSVFVISSSASLAQAVAKACYSLPLDESITMLSNLPDTYAIFVGADGSVTYSDGLTDAFELTVH